MNGIAFGIDENGKTFVKSQFDKSLDATPEELQIANHFIEILKIRKPDTPVVLKRRSDIYLSLCSGDNDFLRFKYTSRSRWISVDADSANLSAEDPRFSAQKDKGQRHWKANISDLSALSSFDQNVVDACRFVEY